MKQLFTMVLAMGVLLGCQKSEELNPQPLPAVGEGFTLVSTSDFSSRNNYNVTGTLEVWRDSIHYEFRFIDFSLSNGPDLDILLTTGLNTSPSIDLGPIKGLRGNFVYTYTDTDNRVQDFSNVVVWCSRFSVAFGLAPFEQ